MKSLPMSEWHAAQVARSLVFRCPTCDASPGQRCAGVLDNERWAEPLPGGWTHSLRWPHNRKAD
jgi:hypothetical protein